MKGLDLNKTMDLAFATILSSCEGGFSSGSSLAHRPRRLDMPRNGVPEMGVNFSLAELDDVDVLENPSCVSMDLGGLLFGIGSAGWANAHPVERVRQKMRVVFEAALGRRSPEVMDDFMLWFGFVGCMLVSNVAFRNPEIFPVLPQF